MSDSRNFLASHSISSFPLRSAGRAPLRQTRRQLSLALPASRDGRQASMLYVVEGICNLSAHGRRFQLIPGEYCLLQPGSAWQADSQELIRTRVQIVEGFFPLNALAMFSTDKWFSELPVIRVEANSHLSSLLRDTEAAGDTSEYLLDALKADADTALVIMEKVMGRNSDWREAVCRRLWSARDFLAREAPTNPALEDIAQLCCFSKSHFLRQYRLAFGMTPGEYVVQRKLRIAQLLVTATNCSVTQIANLSGYDSSSAFCRSFKACFGHSPQRFGRLYAA